MAFLLSKKKGDLIELAAELGCPSKPKIKNLTVKSPDYVEKDVKALFHSIVQDRIRKEAEEKEEKLHRVSEREAKIRREEREYELERLRMQAQKNTNMMNNSENVQGPKLIHEAFHKFNMKDNVSYPRPSN
ncbi:peptidase A2 domain-containing protein [Trichonephila inaurata madagascariensis]|uniref:Peptidase A2 domain-containing protein n=1 Tax=Trichonephila inaurata madagascariensis TaxID=2747483 RepID=A0A8X6Y9U7_9ARAC|nr:peptidase A2 domain-containing protein [Trichonephila inaurata madagascariensis]